MERPPLHPDLTKHDEIIDIINDHAETNRYEVWADAIEDQYILIPRAGVPNVGVDQQYLPTICINASPTWHQSLGRLRTGGIEHTFGKINILLARVAFLLDHPEFEDSIVEQSVAGLGSHALVPPAPPSEFETLVGKVFGVLALQGGTFSLSVDLERGEARVVAGLEFGQEAEDSGMVGGAVYAAEASIRDAFLRMAGEL